MPNKPDLELDKNSDSAGDEKSTVAKLHIDKLHMHKRVERKEDGRHLLYYTFSDKMPLPDNSAKTKGD